MPIWRMDMPKSSKKAGRDAMLSVPLNLAYVEYSGLVHNIHTAFVYTIYTILCVKIWR